MAFVNGDPVLAAVGEPSGSNHPMNLRRLRNGAWESATFQHLTPNIVTLTPDRNSVLVGLVGIVDGKGVGRVRSVVFP